MPTIDDKVVAMSFESSKFEQGVDSAIHSLKKLQDALRFPEAGKALSVVSAQAKEMDFGHIHKGIDGIAEKLGALRLVAIAVFADLAKKAVAAGTQMIKALTIQPLLQGFHEYETQINAVQTILANTAVAGTNIKDVNKALDELNRYADKTIYNFAEMTRNIGTFTAAGVDLKTSVASIKGIANLAAVSGSNAQQASTAMYQLSQAISSGTVKLMDWNSVVNAGMGGALFQRALANTAVHMGTLKKGAVELAGPMKTVRVNGESFRNSLSAAPGKEGWLSSKVLTETLKQLSGDMTDAQLKAQGWSEAQIKAIQEQARMAVEAATKVKTLTQLLSTTKEQLGSGWAQTWRIIFGDFAEAKVLFTGISDAIGEIIMKSAQSRNKVLKDWKALGGRKVLISALSETFHALGDIIGTVKDAFRDIFPPVTGKQLYELTLRFKEFTEMLKPSPETLELLKRTFRGLFAILSIGKQILGGIFTVFGKVFGAIGDGTGGFLEFTASVGDWLVKLDKTLKEGGKLNNFFERLGEVLAKPIELLMELSGILRSAFSGGSTKAVDGMTQAMGPLSSAMEAFGDILGKVFDQVSQLSGIFQPVLQAWVDLLAKLPSLLGQALSNFSFEPILAVIRTGLLAGIFLLFKNFLGKGAFTDQLARGFAGIGGGILKNINASFAALTGSLTALQQNLKAKTLKEIAIAVALLAASMVALSFVDPKKLNTALGAITIAFGQLLGAMAILGNVSKSLGFIKMPVIAATLIILAGAIFTLSASVIALSFLSWEELAKGLGAVAVLLGVIIVAVGPLSAASFGMLKAGIGLTAIAVALNILALAVRQFGSMDLMQLGKGLGAIGISLFIIATYMKMMPPGPAMAAQGAGLILIAGALNILALAVLSLGSMDLRTLGTGMAAIGVGLVIIAGAMRLMPPGPAMAIQAAGLLILSVALNGIALAVRSMGGMSLEQLAKGMGALAYSLGLLVGVLNLMSGAVVGAIALGIAAAGIALLAPALVLLGKQDIKTLAVGLIALAAALGIIAGVGILLDAAAPGILAFGIAVALVGAGLALAGAGIMLAALGISALVSAIVVAAGVIPQAFIDIQKSLIENAKLLVLGLLEIVQAFADTAPQFVDAIVKILSSLIDALIQLMPKVEELTTVLIETLIRVLDQQQGPIIEAAISLILALLTGIRNHIGEVVKVALEIVQNLLLGIARNIGKVINAGAKVIIALLDGIARNYAKVVTTALSILTRFLSAIAGGLGRVVTAGGRIITSFLNGIAQNIRRVANAATNVIVSFINAIGAAGPRVIAAATNTIIKFINALQQNANKIADAGAKAIVAFLNGIARSIETYAPQMRNAGLRIGFAIIDGMTFGLASKGRELLSKASDLANKVKDKLKGAFGIKSPSKFAEEIGQNVVLGLANGMSDNGKAVDAAGDVSNGVINTFKDAFEITSPSKVMKRVGREVTAGFAEGIKTGAEEDIKGAFAELRRRLAEQEAELARQIARRNALRKEGKERTKEEDAELKKLNATLGKHKEVLDAVNRAQTYLNKGITKNKVELFKVAGEYRKLLETIDKVTETIQTLKDQYSALPEIIREVQDEEGETRTLTGAEQLQKYTEALTAQVAAVQKYNTILQQLRAAGLDDTTYQMLLAEGTAGQQFAEALLAGGPAAINQIRSLDTDLGSASETLGTNAAKNLYAAGIDAAKGLLAGLESEKKRLEALMVSLANTMVTTIKRKLKIKSPSEVFAEIGQLSMEGMAQGFADSSQILTDAIDVAAEDALTAMERSMRDISDIVTDQLDPNPVITPVLDLTQIQAKQGELAALTNVVPITASVSSAQAASISTGTAAAEEAALAPGGTSFKFEQNNYSPEALSDIEIYRQTKNQISQIKAALALT